MRLPLLGLLALAVTIAAAGCAESSDDQPAEPDEDMGTDEGTLQTSPGEARQPQTLEVMAMDNAFTPQRATIHVGDTVRWVDHDSANPHNVVSDSPGNEFRSPDMDAALPTHAKEYSRTFTAAGTVDYVCEYHPGMVGTLTVES